MTTVSRYVRPSVLLRMRGDVDDLPTCGEGAEEAGATVEDVDLAVALLAVGGQGGETTVGAAA
ncbi:hypothetical protein GCM10010230_24280 [Streptomyces narbonensis]|uniref:hypothetical protein n=1 Tax=Streptomyces narbonensis TaxID=67333 RepID=UPI001677FEAB|nr:hypothetical protein [Streptomyces narbonensis]GGV99072.1 hypothetical protein GCM10010230_24280 [Streptomyces narbonensis]